MKKILNLLFLITFLFISNSYPMSKMDQVAENENTKSFMKKYWDGLDVIGDFGWLLNRVKGIFVSPTVETDIQSDFQSLEDELEIENPADVELESEDEPELEIEFLEVEPEIMEPSYVGQEVESDTALDADYNLNLISFFNRLTENFDSIMSDGNSFNEFVEEYIQVVGDIDVQNNNGDTLLHTLIGLIKRPEDCKSFVVNLLDIADIYIRNHKGISPFDLAFQDENDRQIKFDFLTEAVKRAKKENQEDKLVKLKQLARKIGLRDEYIEFLFRSLNPEEIMHNTLRVRRDNTAEGTRVQTEEQDNSLNVFELLKSSVSSDRTKVLFDYIMIDGSNLDIQDDEGNTLLHYAIRAYQKTSGYSDVLEWEIVNQLLKNRANIFIPNNNDEPETPFNLLLSTDKREHKTFQAMVLYIAIDESKKITDEDSRHIEQRRLMDIAIEKNIAIVVDGLVRKYHIEPSIEQLQAAGGLSFKIIGTCIREQMEAQNKQMEAEEEEIVELEMAREKEQQQIIFTFFANHSLDAFQELLFSMEDEDIIKLKDDDNNTILHHVVIGINSLLLEDNPVLEELNAYKYFLTLLLEYAQTDDMISFLIQENSHKKTPLDLWRRGVIEIQEEEPRRAAPEIRKERIGYKTVERIYALGYLLEEIGNLINSFDFETN